MLAEITGFDSVMSWALYPLIMLVMMALLYVCYALAYVMQSWPNWQKKLQEWEQQRKEHQQKVEATLSEIRDLLRQKP